MSGRSLGGRARQYQRVTRQRPSRAPAAVVSGVSYLETFPTDGDLDVTPEDLTWNVDPFGGVPAVSGAACSVPAGLGSARAEHDTNTVDMYVQAELVNTDSNSDLFLIGRAGDSADISTDQGVYLFVNHGASDTAVELGGWSPSGVIDSDTLGVTGDATWRLELEGTDARAYRDGVLVLSGTCSATPTGTRAGFQLSVDTTPPLASIDTFEFGDL
jgi:hypothetical protein